MTADFTKFPFSGITNPQASNVTDAISFAPVDNGYVLLLLKTEDMQALTEPVRDFAKSLRANAANTGFTEVMAYRHMRLDEMGGAMPYDQPICETAVRNAERHVRDDPDKFPALKNALPIVEGPNKAADWAVFIEFETPEQALAASKAFKNGDKEFAVLTHNTTSYSVNTFKNKMRYGHVSRDPNVIQFFNLFPGPGNPDELWPSWEEALRWFFEVGEFHSSFPMLAIDPDQPMILVNYAHVESTKHFYLSAFYDPTYAETIKKAYVDNGYTLPLPFFCKIVPV